MKGSSGSSELSERSGSACWKLGLNMAVSWVEVLGGGNGGGGGEWASEESLEVSKRRVCYVLDRVRQIARMFQATPPKQRVDTRQYSPFLDYAIMASFVQYATSCFSPTVPLNSSSLHATFTRP